jgi:hypothetical protein
VRLATARDAKETALAKFLILTHPVEPPTDSQFARIDSCIRHFVSQHHAGRARVFPAAGRKGYAILIDARDHADVIDFLYGNSMTFDEDYQVFPLAEIDDEIAALRRHGHI